LYVWLPRFQTDRLKAKHDGVTRSEFLGVSVAGKGGNRLVAVNEAAARIGLRAGQLLTDAMAIEPSLVAVPQDKAAEAAELKRLALWCRRYAPWVAVDGADGIRLDVTGSAHLFGGEDALLANVLRCLEQGGFAVRAAIASTHAAAWAMARFAPSASFIVPEGEEQAYLSPLPVRALAIAEDKAELLDRFGLKTIGALFAMPRESLRARFGDELLLRLDQATGKAGESLTALAYEPVYREHLDFHEPVTSLDAIGEAARVLIEKVTARLRDHGQGARAFTLMLFDTQGGSADVSLRLSRASQDAGHVTKLFANRFSALEGRFDETLGFDGACLLASRNEALIAFQLGLEAEPVADRGDLTRLLDRLTARLGDEAVRRFAFHESHVPERASVSVPVLRGGAASKAPGGKARPFLLLPLAEEIAVMAELPDYPPRRFTWRRLSRRVVKAEGPERIAAEWWRKGEDAAPPRDYYTVEDEAGRRYWLYREGLYGADGGNPRWFVHGLFA
jgi:protein ImuB